eukprot:c7817_g1_i1 orf=292-468(+)
MSIDQYCMESRRDPCNVALWWVEAELGDGVIQVSSVCACTRLHQITRGLPTLKRLKYG